QKEVATRRRISSTNRRSPAGPGPPPARTLGDVVIDRYDFAARHYLPPPRRRHVIAGLTAVGGMLSLVLASVMSHHGVGTITTAGEAPTSADTPHVLALEVVAPSLPPKTVDSPVVAGVL